MTEKTVNITIECPESLRNEMQIALLEQGIKPFQIGYIEILKLGLQKFKKQNKSKN